MTAETTNPLVTSEQEASNSLDLRDLVCSEKRLRLFLLEATLEHIELGQGMYKGRYICPTLSYNAAKLRSDLQKHYNVGEEFCDIVKYIECQIKSQISEVINYHATVELYLTEVNGTSVTPEEALAFRTNLLKHMIDEIKQT